MVNPTLAASVFIPTRNRADVLRRTLPSILNQSIGSDEYEVIVVDDDSDDDTADVLASCNHPRLVWWSRRRNSPSGISHGRNEAIDRSRGQILLSTDDDCFLPPNYLRAHLKGHGSCSRRVVTGPIAEISETPSELRIGARARSMGWHTNPFPGCNGSVSRALMEEVGRYDTEFDMYGWEDLEIYERFRAAGARRKYVGCAGVLHYKPRVKGDYSGRIRQEIMRGTMGALYHSKHPKFTVALSTKQHIAYRLFDWGVDSVFGLGDRVRKVLEDGEEPQSAVMRYLVKSHAEISGRKFSPLIVG
ncbi:MAG: glycosyltransferase [Pseudomonadota bacterium]